MSKFITNAVLLSLGIAAGSAGMYFYSNLIQNIACMLNKVMKKSRCIGLRRWIQTTVATNLVNPRWAWI